MPIQPLTFAYIYKLLCNIFSFIRRKAIIEKHNVEKIGQWKITNLTPKVVANIFWIVDDIKRDIHSRRDVAFNWWQREVSCKLAHIPLKPATPFNTPNHAPHLHTLRNHNNTVSRPISNWKSRSTRQKHCNIGAKRLCQFPINTRQHSSPSLHVVQKIKEIYALNCIKSMVSNMPQ